MITGNEMAFPDPIRLNGQNIGDLDKGVDIRAYIATQAMIGLLANPTYHNPDKKHNMITVPALAETAVCYADHLIIALNKTI